MFLESVVETLTLVQMRLLERVRRRQIRNKRARTFSGDECGASARWLFILHVECARYACLNLFV